MATPSPSQSNNSTDNGVSQPATSASASASAPPFTAPVSRLHRVDAPAAPKTLRGLNKPKWIQCGNVARSRCPYQSCKSCCLKAQNSCYIHGMESFSFWSTAVLKQSATVPDKAPFAGSPKVDEQSHEASLSGPSHRVPS